MTFIDIQGHSLIAGLFKCDFSYSYAAGDKILTDMPRRAVLLENVIFLAVLSVLWTSLPVEVLEDMIRIECNMDLTRCLLFNLLLKL